MLHEGRTFMRKLSKEILSVICLCVMLALTACGSNNDMNNQTPAENNMNDATENTQDNLSGDRNDNSMTDGNGGVIDDLGTAVGEGINDIGNGVENITDDLTGNNRDNIQK